KKIHISEKTTLTGFIEGEQIPAVYADADIFAFASQTETQGLVVPEALASGLPCVVVDDPAFEGVIGDGYNGLVAKDEPASFSSKIIKLLEKPELRRQLSRNAAKFANEHFSVEQQAEAHLKVYRLALRLRKNKKTQAEVLKEKFSAIRNFLEVNRRLTDFKQVLTKEIRKGL
ncbi:MAG TPA: glycosyltransferase family 4 protein, partial [Candidatus Nanoarchaeia archaeon]